MFPEVTDEEREYVRDPTSPDLFQRVTILRRTKKLKQIRIKIEERDRDYNAHSGTFEFWLHGFPFTLEKLFTDLIRGDYENWSGHSYYFNLTVWFEGEGAYMREPTIFLLPITREEAKEFLYSHFGEKHVS